VPGSSRSVAISHTVLRGSLRTTSPYLLFRRLAAGERSGVLHLQRDGVHKSIRFERGRIRFAATNRPEERLDAFVVGQRLATWEQVEAAARELGATRRLGAVLVDRGILSPQEQARLIGDQLRGIVLEALGWRDGSYRFEPPGRGLQESVTLDWDVADAVLEEARRAADEADLWSVVGGLDGVVVPPPSGPSRARALNDAERRVLAALDGRRTVSEVAREAAVPPSVAVRTLAAVVRLGGCTVGARRGPQPAEAGPPARRGEAREAAREARDESWRAFLDRGSGLIRDGRLPEAIPSLREAVRLRPDMAVAHFRLGQCLATIPGHAEAARTHLRRATELEPSNPRYREVLRALEPPASRPSRPTLGRRLTRWLHLSLPDD
jgi:tetratricopeptide (TPR) repeat protein